VVRTRKGRAPRRRLADPLRPQPAVLLTPKMEPIGTRIFGPVTRELRHRAVHEDRLVAPEVL